MKRQLSFDEFMKILEMFLKDNNYFGKKYSLEDFKRVRRDIESIYLLYTEGKKGAISLEKFSDFCEFFLLKAKNKKILRFTKRNNYTFSSFLEEIIESKFNDGFKDYMLFLKKNQKVITCNDAIRIYKKFNIIDLPKETKLKLLDTKSNFSFLIFLESKDNLNRIKKIFQENFEDAYIQYQKLKNEDDGKIPKSYILFYLSESFKKIKLLDQGHDLFELEEEQRALVYLNVYLYDYMKVDQEFWDKAPKDVALDFKQIRNFLKFLCLSIEKLEIVEKNVKLFF